MTGVRSLRDWARGLWIKVTEFALVTPNRVQLGRLSIGDVVCLRSGGPSMTVAEIDGEQIKCTWFLKQGQLVQQSIDFRLLQPGKERFVVFSDPAQMPQPPLYLSDGKGSTL